jgi:hypothetical protein
VDFVVQLETCRKKSVSVLLLVKFVEFPLFHFLELKHLVVILRYLIGFLFWSGWQIILTQFLILTWVLNLNCYSYHLL